MMFLGGSEECSDILSHFGHRLPGLYPREDLIHNAKCSSFSRYEAAGKVSSAQNDADILTTRSGS